MDFDSIRRFAVYLAPLGATVALAVLAAAVVAVQVYQFVAG